MVIRGIIAKNQLYVLGSGKLLQECFKDPIAITKAFKLGRSKYPSIMIKLRNLVNKGLIYKALHFLKKFLEDMSFLWGHWYPYFGLLVISALGFKAMVGSLACFLTCGILRFTSGVTPADCIEASMAAKPFWPTHLQMCLQTLLEVQGSNPWPSVWWAQRCIPFGHSG